MCQVNGSHPGEIAYSLNQVTIGNLTYTYDALNRRTGVGGSLAATTLPLALTSATYDAANQLATWNGTAFSYDANGSLVSDGQNTYTWKGTKRDRASPGAGHCVQLSLFPPCLLVSALSAQ